MSMDKLVGLATRVAGFAAGAVAQGRFGQVASFALVAGSLYGRGKTTGILRGVISGAGIAGGLGVAEVGVNALDRSNLLGQYEGQVLGPIQSGLGAVRGITG